MVHQIAVGTPRDVMHYFIYAWIAYLAIGGIVITVMERVKMTRYQTWRR